MKYSNFNKKIRLKKSTDIRMKYSNSNKTNHIWKSLQITEWNIQIEENKSDLKKAKDNRMKYSNRRKQIRFKKVYRYIPG